MKYELKFNEVGKMNGWQVVECVVNGQKVREQQLFVNGRFACGFVNVFGVGSSVYTFKTENWGTMEITRDAAEMFAADELFNVILQPGTVAISKIAVPMTEEAFI